jgi:hypothetical protein
MRAEARRPEYFLRTGLLVKDGALHGGSEVRVPFLFTQFEKFHALGFAEWNVFLDEIAEGQPAPVSGRLAGVIRGISGEIGGALRR